MLKYFINKICGKFIFAPRIMICIPSQVTEVEKKAVIDAASQAGARKVYLIEEPIAAAIGAGIDISKPCGNMVVDIGGGTTDIAVISLGGSVVSTSLKVAGEAVVTEFIFNVTSFLECITFQGIGCFRYVIMTIDGSQAYYFCMTGCYFLYFIQLMLGVCCEYKFHICKYLNKKALLYDI